MKTKKVQVEFLIKMIVPIIVCIVVILGCQIRLVEDGVYVGNSIFYDYAYTMYSDYAVLEEFKGKEQEEIVIPTQVWGKPVTMIGWKCFERRKQILTVVLHDNIEVIEGFAFQDCDNLVQVVNGTNVKRIDTQAFFGCRNLETVEIGEQLQTIGLATFYMCESLKKLSYQKHLVLIDDYAFAESGLEEFIFNHNVQIGNDAFANTLWLFNQKEEFVIYGDGDLVWYNGSSTEIIIPKGVKTLLWGCFNGIDAIDVYLPETVTKIEEFAFIDCEDVKVYIPYSVVEMGNEKEECGIANSDVEITIITTQDSYAHQYAIDHDIPYEIVESW